MSIDMLNFKTYNLHNKLLKAVASVLILSFGFASMAMAQSSKMVTLKTETDLEISGELLSYTDISYEIDSPFGVIVFPTAGVTCLGQSCPENIKVKPMDVDTDATSTNLDDSWVILNSIEGNNQVAGKLLGIENDEYIIDTLVGQLQITKDTVTCIGALCAAEDDTNSNLVVLVGESRRLEGKLIESTQDFHFLEIDGLDTFKVQRDLYQCIGAACP